MLTSTSLQRMKISPILLAIVFLCTLFAAIFTHQLLWLLMVPILALILVGFVYPSFFYFLLFFTIPISTEWQITPSLGTDFPDEPLMWGISALIIMMIAAKKKVPISLLRQPIFLLLIAGLFWAVLCTLFSTHPLLSVKYVLAKLWYIIPFCGGVLLFVRSPSDYGKLAKCLLIPMGFVVLVILFRHSLSGFSFDRVNKINGPFFRNHVNYSALLVCCIPIVYGLMRWDIRLKKWWTLLLILFLVGLFFSYARGAWLALCVGLLVVLAIRKRIVHWFLLGCSLFVMIAGIWLVSRNNYLRFSPNYAETIYHAGLSDHLEATYTMKDLSAVERFYRWIAAIRMAADCPVTGFGPNTFYNNYRGYTVNAFTTYVSNNPEHSTVHNYFLMQLAEQGVMGLLLFFALFVTMILTAQQMYHRYNDPFYKHLVLIIGCILGMIGILICVSDLIETDKIGSIFYLCAGSLLHVALRMRKYESREIGK